MFPATHDITPGNLAHSMAFLEGMLKQGNELLIVSKPHIECIRRICGSFDQYRQNILFWFTISSEFGG
jgi:hypothetical protein